MYFDTHVHFDGWDAAATEAVLGRAADVGVRRMIAVGGSSAATARAREAADAFPGAIRAAVGFDRDCATGGYSLPELESLIRARRPAALGEIGLDFHYHPETAAAQERLFGEMLDLARRHRLPAVVHSREAEDSTLAMLRAHAAAWSGAPGGLGVLHCFTGSDSFARHTLDLGFHISFSGILTFRNAADLREAARLVPADRLLIETDSPLLAPVPHRGRPNEPAYLPLVDEALAAARGERVEQIAETTTRNALTLFEAAL